MWFSALFLPGYVTYNKVHFKHMIPILLSIFWRKISINWEVYWVKKFVIWISTNDFQNTLKWLGKHWLNPIHIFWSPPFLWCSCMAEWLIIPNIIICNGLMRENGPDVTSQVVNRSHWHDRMHYGAWVLTIFEVQSWQFPN